MEVPLSKGTEGVVGLETLVRKDGASVELQISLEQRESMMTTEYAAMNPMDGTRALDSDSERRWRLKLNHSFPRTGLMCNELVLMKEEGLTSSHQIVLRSVRILLDGEILEVQGEKPEKDLGSLACIKADEKKLDDHTELTSCLKERYPSRLDDLYDQLQSSVTLFDQKDLNIALKGGGSSNSDYECEIKYHPGKANVVADALSRKRKTQAREGLKTHFKHRDDGEIYFFDRISDPSVGGVRKLIMDEAHTSRYSVHPGADKMVTRFEIHCFGGRCSKQGKIKEARSRRKSYADKRRKPLESSWRRVVLKDISMKGVGRIGTKEQASTTICGTHTIGNRGVCWIPVAYYDRSFQES
ncbi:hypothetical protein Tco_0971800 [Tanacetum coccineum]